MSGDAVLGVAVVVLLSVAGIIARRRGSVLGSVALAVAGVLIVMMLSDLAPGAVLGVVIVCGWCMYRGLIIPQIIRPPVLLYVAASGLAGVGVWHAGASIVEIAQGGISPGAVATVVVSGAIAIAATALLFGWMEKKMKMKSIMELVPAGQRATIKDFVSVPDQRANRGQYADFSRVDQAEVVEQIEERVIGQDAIVESVVATAFRRARLRRANKPVATFLFVGATGGGKTELAKALASSLFASERNLIRVDCAEMSEASTVARLIGSPPGYMGSDEGSVFCRDIGRIGTGIILFDEIEKAHQAVVRTIMALLDEGRITEQSTSTTYSATGFVIVMTSNAAASEIAQIIDADNEPTARRSARVKDALRAAGFLPEILARIDAVFPFGRLSREAITEIIGRFLVGFGVEAGVEIVAVDAELLIDLVAKQESLADYGVREVVRLVEHAVVDGLLAVQDRGHSRAAIRVIDGHVQVQPVADDVGGDRA